MEDKLLTIDIDSIPSMVLRRIISEIRNEEYHPEEKPSSYNRFHNRHFKSRYPPTKFQQEWDKKYFDKSPEDPGKEK